MSSKTMTLVEYLSAVPVAQMSREERTSQILAAIASAPATLDDMAKVRRLVRTRMGSLPERSAFLDAVDRRLRAEVARWFKANPTLMPGTEL